MENDNNSGKCTACAKLFYELKVRKSTLKPGLTLFLCDKCYDNKFEPSWLVALVASEPNGGLMRARDHIRKHRYPGPKILLEDLDIR